jgi:hypothetical protein
MQLRRASILHSAGPSGRLPRVAVYNLPGIVVVVVVVVVVVGGELLLCPPPPPPPSTDTQVAEILKEVNRLNL